jgi:drug/metabolite transporter (DMT)-like permease
MWSTLGLFTAASGKTPPFLLNGICFAISGLFSLCYVAFKGRLFYAFPKEGRVWLLGIGGLFGYHFFYFTSLRLAPPVDSNLINYLWPLLIVVFSSFLAGESLKIRTLVGALLGFAAVLFLFLGRSDMAFTAHFIMGYLSALACAIICALYSVLSRRYAHIPTEAVTGFCLVTSLLSFVCHVLFEQTILPQNLNEWLAVLGLGLFPVGLAFFVWDIGCKRGNIQMLGVLAYAAPILSTLLLILFGFGVFSFSVAMACIFITLGAFIASYPKRKQRVPEKQCS